MHSAGNFFAPNTTIFEVLCCQAPAPELDVLGIWHTHPLGGGWSIQDTITNAQWAKFLDGCYSLLVNPKAKDVHCAYISVEDDSISSQVTIF
jgi:hypothetical protein